MINIMMVMMIRMVPIIIIIIVLYINHRTMCDLIARRFGTSTSDAFEQLTSCVF